MTVVDDRREEDDVKHALALLALLISLFTISSGETLRAHQAAAEPTIRPYE